MARIALAVFAVGVAEGQAACDSRNAGDRDPVMLLQAAPIDRCADSPVAVKGDVAEIFGNKIIVQDDSGQARAWISAARRTPMP